MADSSDFFNTSTFMKYATIPSSLIIMILLCLERRVQPNIFGYYYPALLVPVRFLDGFNNRWSYALCFGSIISIMINVFSGSAFSSVDSSGNRRDTLFCGSHDPTSSEPDVCENVWIKTLILQAQTLLASMVCVPHFLCITTSYKLVGAILGLLYSLYWLVFYIVNLAKLGEAVDSTFIQQEKAALRLIIASFLPIVFCSFGLCARSVWMIYKCYVNKSVRFQVVDKVIEKHQVQHVITLFHKPVTRPPPRGWREKMERAVRSQWCPHFKLPTHILCVATTQLLIMYFMAIMLAIFGLSLRIVFESMALSQYADAKETIADIFDGTYGVSVVIALVTSIIYIILFVVNYRFNMINIYRGNKHKLFPLAQRLSPAKHVIASLRLPAYQIAYSLWSLLITLFVVFFILYIIAMGIFILDYMDRLGKVVAGLAQMLSVPVITLIIFFLQVLLVRIYFLQPKLNSSDSDPPLNVDNRHLFEVLGYVLLFTNLVMGLMSALLRMVKSLAVGIVFLGRLDKCLMITGFEFLDPGYKAYVGALFVDNAHNNPVMRAFCAVLVSLTSKPQDRVNLGIAQLMQPEKSCSNSKAARRWHLAYTLIKNPDLQACRKSALSTRASTISDYVNVRFNPSAHDNPVYVTMGQESGVSSNEITLTPYSLN